MNHKEFMNAVLGKKIEWNNWFGNGDYVIPKEHFFDGNTFGGVRYNKNDKIVDEDRTWDIGDGIGTSNRCWSFVEDMSIDFMDGVIK